MLRRAIAICVILSPLISSYPQAPQYLTNGQTYVNPYEQPQPQEYTDSPDAKIISVPPETTSEKLAARPVAKTSRSRVRTQPLQNIQYQPTQLVSTEQPIQTAQSVQPVQPVQYQQAQYEPQYVQRHRPQQPDQQFQPSEAVPHHEHRHSTTTYIPILKFDKSQSLDGSYKQSWETGNNIIAEETGYLKNVGVKDQEASLVQQGSYTYTAPDGSIITTSYTADEGGFHVEGSHLPTPPPIPEEIQKGLDQIYEGIRLQQEADAKEAKSGKPRPGSYVEENSVSDNYPVQYQQYQQYQKAQSQDQQLQQAQTQAQAQAQAAQAQTQRQLQQQYRKQQRSSPGEQAEQNPQ